MKKTYHRISNGPPGLISEGRGHVICNVVKTRINHPFGNGLYNLFLMMTGGRLMIALTTLFGGFPK